MKTLNAQLVASSLAVLVLTGTIGIAQAQLLSAYDGDEPGLRSWVTEVDNGTFVGGPFSAGEALASDQSTGRVFQSSGSRILTLELVGDNEFRTVTNVPATYPTEGKNFRGIQSLAYGNDRLYAYNLQRTASIDPPSGLYEINESTGEATLLLPGETLPIPDGGFFSGMTFDPNDRILYILIRTGLANDESGYSIHSLHPDTGHTELVVQFAYSQFNSAFDGLAFGEGRLFITAGNRGDMAVFETVGGRFDETLPSPRRFGNGPGGSTFASFLQRFIDGPGGVLDPPRNFSAFYTNGVVRLSVASNFATNFAFNTFYRGLSPEGPFETLPSDIDSSVNTGLTYFYFATATNTSGQESEPTRTVSVSIPAAYPEAALSVKRVVARTKTNKKGRIQGRGVVTVVDGSGNPVRNVVVTASFSGDFDETASAVTNQKGRAVVKTSTRIDQSKSFSFCIESLEKAGFGYDPAGNLRTCASR